VRFQTVTVCPVSIRRLQGISSKVALAAFIATFPIVVSTAAGLHATTENERFLFAALDLLETHYTRTLEDLRSLPLRSRRMKE
jgi:ABC-type nitrate/sulfonate/bicarbonate transport system permease component